MRRKEHLLTQVNPRDFYESEGHDLHDGVGWVEAGLCAFHSDKKSGSYFIHAEEGAWICFSCGEKGSNIIEYRMRSEGSDSMQALKSIEDQWGVS